MYAIHSPLLMHILNHLLNYPHLMIFSYSTLILLLSYELLLNISLILLPFIIFKYYIYYIYILYIIYKQRWRGCNRELHRSLATVMPTWRASSTQRPCVSPREARALEGVLSGWVPFPVLRDGIYPLLSSSYILYIIYIMYNI